MSWHVVEQDESDRIATTIWQEESIFYQILYYKRSGKLGYLHGTRFPRHWVGSIPIIGTFPYAVFWERATPEIYQQRCADPERAFAVAALA